jgi:hypothetical protein
MDGCQDFAFLLPAYVLFDLLGVHKDDRGKVVQWSVDFVDFFNVVPISVDTSQRLTQSVIAGNRGPITLPLRCRERCLANSTMSFGQVSVF